MRAEPVHHVVLLGGAHLAVQQVDARFREDGLQVVGELRGGEEFEVLVLLNEGGDDERLPPFADLAHDEPVRLLPGGVLNQFGFDGRAARWKFVDDAEFQIAVCGQRQRAGDGRGAHDEHVGAAREELAALLHAEAVFLVHDGQPEVVEADVLLNERLRAHDDVHVPLRDAGLHLQFRLGGHRADQEAHADVELPEVPDEVRVVLPREDLGGSHQRALVAVPHGEVQGAGGHGGLAAPHVPLNEAGHLAVAAHVVRDFQQHAPLRVREAEGQGTLEGVDVVALRIEAFALQHGILTLEEHAQFQEQVLVEAQAVVRAAQVRLVRREVDAPQRVAQVGHAVLPPPVRGQVIVERDGLQRAERGAAQELLRDAVLRVVHAHDPPGAEAVLRAVHRLQVLHAQLHAAPEALHAARQDQPGPLAELLLHPRLVEPRRLHAATGRRFQRHVQDLHAGLGAAAGLGDHAAFHRDLLPFLDLGQVGQGAAVLVAVRVGVQHVAQQVQAQRMQLARAAGATVEPLNRRVRREALAGLGGGHGDPLGDRGGAGRGLLAVGFGQQVQCRAQDHLAPLGVQARVSGQGLTHLRERIPQRRGQQFLHAACHHTVLAAGRQLRRQGPPQFLP